jgi:hypothetical protein
MVQNFKFKDSSEIQGKLLAVIPCKIKKTITYLQGTVAQSKHSHSREKNRKLTSKNQNKAILKPSRENIKS